MERARQTPTWSWLGWLIPATLVAAAIAGLCWIGVDSRRARDLPYGGVVATGTVVGHTESHGRGRDVIRFTSRDGRVVEEAAWAGYIGSRPMGDQVEVEYVPDDPTVFVEDGYRVNGAIVVFSFGLAGLVAAAVLFFLIRALARALVRIIG